MTTSMLMSSCRNWGREGEGCDRGAQSHRLALPVLGDCWPKETPESSGTWSPTHLKFCQRDYEKTRWPLFCPIRDEMSAKFLTILYIMGHLGLLNLKFPFVNHSTLRLKG